METLAEFVAWIADTAVWMVVVFVGGVIAGFGKLLAGRIAKKREYIPATDAPASPVEGEKKAAKAREKMEKKALKEEGKRVKKGE